jgi:hypothetical protein
MRARHEVDQGIVDEYEARMARARDVAFQIQMAMVLNDPDCSETWASARATVGLGQRSKIKLGPWAIPPRPPQPARRPPLKCTEPWL